MVYHVDVFSRFMDMSAMEKWWQKSIGPKVQTLMQTFRVNEAMRAFREAAQPGLYYSIPRPQIGGGPSSSSSGGPPSAAGTGLAGLDSEPLAKVMQPAEADARSLLGLPRIAGTADLDDGFEDDAGTASTTLPKPRVPHHDLVFFQLVSAHPDTLGRKDRIDRRTDEKGLTARDIAVSEHLALQYDSQNMTAEVSMVPVSHPVGARMDQVLILHDAVLTEVQVWQLMGAPCMQWTGKPGPDELEPSLAARCLEAFAQSGARHGTIGYVSPTTLSAEMLDAMRCLVKLGLADEVHGGFQLSSTGTSSVLFYHKVGNPTRLMDLNTEKPYLQRSSFALLHALETAGWDVIEHRKEDPLPPSCTFNDMTVTGRQAVVVAAARATLCRAYLACLASVSDQGETGRQFRKDLLALGISAINHLEPDSYYKALMDPTKTTAAALPMDDEVGVNSTPRQQGLKRQARFKLAQSQKWGCVSILGKKTRGNPALQCCCPVPDHNAGKQACNFTLAFQPSERSLVLHRFKAWIVKGLQCPTRFAHQKLKQIIKEAPLEDLPSLVDLEAQRPDETLGDSTGKATAGRKRKRCGDDSAAASSKEGRGGRAGRGGRGRRGSGARGSAATAGVAASSTSGTTGATASSSNSSSRSSMSDSHSSSSD